MAFTINTFQDISASLAPDGPQWKYTSADTLATIEASAYFNMVAQRIDVNQLIDIYGSDGHILAVFTSANGVVPVTIAKFVPA